MIYFSFQRQEDVRHFLKSCFPSGNSPQVANFQLCNFPSVNFPSVYLAAVVSPPATPTRPILAAALSPCNSLQRLRSPNLTFGKLSLWKMALGKSPLGKWHLGSPPWENVYPNQDDKEYLSMSVYLALSLHVQTRQKDKVKCQHYLYYIVTYCTTL